MKTALIRQPAGLGDILYIQSFIDDIARRGFHVIYPVIDHYYDSVTKNIKTNNSNFVRLSELDNNLLSVYSQTREIINNDFEYYPFDCITDPTTESFRPEFSGLSVMGVKDAYYSSINPEYANGDSPKNDWRDSVKLIRDFEREKEYENRVGISGDEDFIWVNRFFGTPPGVVYRDVDIQDKSIKILENDDKLTDVFDVCGVLEKAREIHTVDTCFSYLVELLQTDAELHLYSRRKRTDEVDEDIDTVFNKTGYFSYKKKWNRHL